MTVWQWTNPGQSGDWTTPDWTGDGTQNAGQTYPQGPSDTATIGSGATGNVAYTVAVGSSDDISIASVAVDDSAATLQIQSEGTFSAASIAIDNGATFIAAAGATLLFTDLDVNGGSVNDTGSGTNTGTIDIAISGNDFGNFIAGGMLTNADEGQIAINGGGLLENANSLVNAGTISDNDNGNLTNAGGATLTNNNLIANNGSFVGGALFAGILYNDGDLINAAAGTLDNSGAVNDEAGGNIENDGAMSNSGLVTVFADATMTGSGAYAQSGGTTTVSGSLSQSNVFVQGGNFTLDGGIAQGGSLFETAGTAELSGFGTISSPLVNNGTVIASGGNLDLKDAVTGTGAATIAASSTLELGGADAQSVAFLSSIGTLQLDAPAAFSGTLDGVVVGDVIHLPSVAAAGLTASLQGQKLVISRNGVPVFTYVLGSIFTNESFTVTPDNATGTDIIATTNPVDQWLGGNHDWGAGPWSLGVPTPTTAAAINSQTPATVTIPAGYKATVASLTVGTGDQISDAGTLTVGGTLAVTQADGLAISGNRSTTQATEISAGSITIAGGSYVDDIIGNATISSQSLFNDGTYAFVIPRATLSAAITINGAISGTGTLAIGDPGNALPGAGGPISSIGLTLGGPDNNAISFLIGSQETLTLDDPGGFAGVLEGLAPTDFLDLPGVAPTGTTVSLQGNDLVVSENGSPTFTFALASTFSGEGFRVTALRGGGTGITVVSGRPTGSVDQWVGRNADWGSAIAWSLGVPMPADDVAITTASPATVTIPAGYKATAASLTVGTGDQISDAGTLTVGGTLAVTQADGLAIAGNRSTTQATEISAGSITIAGGSYVDDIIGNATISSQSLFNDGTYAFVIPRATLGAAITINGAISGTGTLAIGDPGNALPGAGGPISSIGLTLGGPDNNAISFLIGSQETLTLDDPGGFAGVLEGLAPTDFLDLPGIAPTGTTASLQGNDLVVSENGSPTFTFALASTFSGEGFRVTALRAGGTEIAIIKT